MKQEIPHFEWLICWNSDKPKEDHPEQLTIPYFFAYVDADGDWWMSLDQEHEEICDAPKYWKRI